MKIRVKNVPVRAFAEVVVEVDEPTPEAVEQAVRALPCAVLEAGLRNDATRGDVDLDRATFDSAWVLEFEPAGKNPFADNED